MSAEGTAPVLKIDDLKVMLPTKFGTVRAVDGASLEAYAGRTLAVVGESGCGKSMTFLAALGLAEEAFEAKVEGEVVVDGEVLSDCSREQRRKIRGDRAALVFQNALQALNPVARVGSQIAESLIVHRSMSRSDAAKRAVEVLELVRFPKAAQFARAYPHELSGGMRQRALIGLAVACDPKVLIADEPTTALDVTIQAEILELLDQLRAELGMALVLITHDFGVVSEHADRVAVMYAGRIVEEGSADEIFARPGHPYTAALMSSLPDQHGPRERLTTIPGEPPSMHEVDSGCAFEPRCFLGKGRPDCIADRPLLHPVSELGQLAACHHVDELRAAKLVSPKGVDRAEEPALTTTASVDGAPVLQVEGLTKIYPLRRTGLFEHKGTITAVDDVSFELGNGETLGIVGESGSGKTTLARMLLRLVEPSSGRVLLDGKDLTAMGANALRKARELIQVVFQDPQSSLNPRMTVGDIVAEPLVIHGRWDRQGPKQVAEMIGKVGLTPEHARRYPHEFSGGQQQRIGIARALILNPRLLILDEPTSALDVSIRAQILNLLGDLKSEFGLSYIFIAHDLSVVHHVSDRVAVIHAGKVVELGAAEDVYRAPKHPYTKSLLASVPRIDRRATA